MMIDKLIYGLSFLFVGAILLWAVSAYAELILYGTVKRIFRSICILLRKNEAEERGNATDYFIVEGSYKNRKIICRLSRISSSSFWNVRLSLHCHVEPLRFSGQHELFAPDRQKQKNPFYPVTSTTVVRTFHPGERFSEAEILAVFEEASKSAEMMENETST